jgi:hypothetical protein
MKAKTIEDLISGNCQKANLQLAVAITWRQPRKHPEEEYW